MNAAVIGLGKIGLPLAVQFACKGVVTVGADIDQVLVDQVNAGRAPFPGEENLPEYLADAIAGGSLRATTSTSKAVSQADVVVVIVPVLIDADGRADFRSIESATQQIARAIQPGTLVCFETTVPVGTTRRRFASLLEKTSGLEAGEDFLVAYSPERVYSGRIFRDLRSYPKLVGGINPESAESAAEFYERVLDFDPRDDLDRPNGVWNLGAVEAAEFVKLAETTYRDVNIALANEFARYAGELGLEAAPIIEAANSQPFSHVHKPGIAVGGHCIPVYPRFYLAGDTEARLPAVAREVNEAVPLASVQSLAEALGGLSGKVVAVLGATYRGGVKETAFSGVFPLVAEIERLGGIPLVHDPLLEPAELEELSLRSYRIGDHCHAAILQADHVEYQSLTPDDLPGCGVVLDGRDMLDRRPWESQSVRFMAAGSPRTADPGTDTLTAT